MKPILTIGITSYKRVNELIRCIKSINTKYKDEIEILVSEDKSPLSDEIRVAVEEISENSEYNIRFTTNEVNLGYDMNLGAIIKKAKGDYIFYMSDDDAVADGCLDEIVPYLKKGTDAGVLYAPFVYMSTGKKDRKRSNHNFVIPAGEESSAKYIYDSILFSGLIFRKDYIKEFDSSRFKNHNYFQVYMFLQMLLKHGGYYFSNPSVLCIGDGENAYGLSDSSCDDTSLANKERNALLADRTSIKSNLEFNKTLIKVIKMFDDDENTHVIDSFAKQYSLHSYSGLSYARDVGKDYFNEYWKTFNELEIKKYPITKAYYAILSILGKEKSDKLLSNLRKMVKKEN